MGMRCAPLLLALVGMTTALRLPPTTHQVLRSAPGRAATRALRMADDEAAPPELTASEAEALRKAEEFEAAGAQSLEGYSFARLRRLTCRARVLLM